MQSLGEMLRGAVTLHQQGRLAEAEQLYTKILETDARQFDALHLLGILKHQRGDSAQALRLLAAAVESNPRSPDALINYAGVLSATNRHADALAYFDRALALKPDRTDAHYNRGNVLIALNRPEEALASYDRALAFKPNDPLTHYNRGHALVALNRREEALAAFDRVLALAPKQPDALINRGNILNDLGRHAEALACYDGALALRSDDVLAHTNRGPVLAALGRDDEALASYDRALSIKPDDVGALTHRAAALIRLSRHAEALACCDRVLSTAPDDAGSLNNKSIALAALGRHEEALACSDRAIAINPDDPDALNNRGIALQGLNRNEEALACYDRALTIRPDHADILANRGNVLKDINRHEEAAADLKRALALKPDHAAAHWNLGLTRLALCDFAGGWQEYEWRWKLPVFAAGQRNLPQPAWNGERVKGTILAWGEQGLGDQILYAGMIPDLATHADAVIVEVEPRLVPLFSRSFPEARIIGLGDKIPDEANVKAQSALASLGQYLRPSLETFPRRERGYLVPDPEKTAGLRQRLSPAGEVVMGVSWISANPAVGKFKTALLRDFEAVLRLPGLRCIDLQYGDTRVEREALKQATGLVVERLEDIDNTNDLDSLAALIGACDLIVTVSNTTAHMAGALGKPVWVFAPQAHGKFWYWFKDRADSPWYPEVRIRRQAGGESWADAITAAGAEISAFVKTAQRSRSA